MKNKIIYLVSCFLLNMQLCVAQPGMIDPAFNPADSGFWKGNGLNRVAIATFIQADGKIIVGGNFSKYHETVKNDIIRFNKDGTIDNLFTTGKGVSGSIHGMELQKDGKIIVAGLLKSYNGTVANYVARLNSNGSLDNTFYTNIVLDSMYFIELNAIALQNDGKIIIGGNFRSLNGNVKSLVRLDSNGLQDINFKTGTGVDGFVSGITLQSDGKMIVAGNFSSYNGAAASNIIRLNPDGTLDPSFDPGTGANNTIYTNKLQADGKIIIGGLFTSYNGSVTNHIARLKSNGSLDSTFIIGNGTNGTEVNTAFIQNDGKIIVSGDFNLYNGTSVNRLIRLDTNGSIDKTFTPGTGPDVPISAIAQQTDGQFILVGAFVRYNEVRRNHLARIDENGSLDKTVFNIWGLGVNGAVWCYALQTDEKIIIGGLFSSYNGVSRNNIMRINADGTLDHTFNPGSGTNNWVESIVLQPDGKILVGGYFNAYNGIPKKGLVRLNNDGSLDNGFEVSTTDYIQVESISLQPDGKIIIGGDIGGFTSQNILRLQSNGIIDTTFNTGTGTNSTVWKTLIQPDGKIIITGFFTNYNGIKCNRIVRLNSNGSIDNTFNVSSGVNNGILTCIQSNGKIIIGGQFTSYNGSPVNRIARLNADGSFDNTFNVGMGANNTIWTSSFLGNDKIMIGGNFTSYDGSAASYIACLNSDGKLDNTFDKGTDYGVFASLLQKDGNIIVGGNFTSYNGVGRNGLARIFGYGPSAVNQLAVDQQLKVYPNPTNGFFYIELDRQTEVTITDILGRSVYARKLNSGKQMMDLTKEINGVYFIRTINGDQQKVERIIINK